MSAYLIYVGKGKGSLPGVPARDLTFSEARKYGEAQLLISGLYALPKMPDEILDANIILNSLKPETPNKKRRSIRSNIK